MGFAHSIGEYVNARAARVFGCSSCTQEVSLLHHNQLQIPISAHIVCIIDLFLDCQIRSGRNGGFFCLIGVWLVFSSSSIRNRKQKVPGDGCSVARLPVAFIRRDPPKFGGRVSDSMYPLVNVYIAMENHHFQWENPLFLWSFSIAMLNYQRVYACVYIVYQMHPIAMFALCRFPLIGGWVLCPLWAPYMLNISQDMI